MKGLEKFHPTMIIVKTLTEILLSKKPKNPETIPWYFNEKFLIKV